MIYIVNYRLKKMLAGTMLLAAILLYSCSSTAPTDDGPVIQDASTNAVKPWTRWWWHGSSVTEAGITAELQAYHEAGIGGLELTPIYGVKGDEANFVPYLSPRWVDLLIHTLKEAERLGMGVDMATGTGWPFGGPWVGAEHACKYVASQQYTLRAGEQLQEAIVYTQKPILRTVNNPTLRLEDLNTTIADNDDLQTLALDQVRFEHPLPLVLLMAYSDAGLTEDLTDKVVDGRLDWTAPDGVWTLYAVFQGEHGKMVERAAPGGEGNVIDHFSTPAITGYLDRFSEALQGQEIQTLRAFFNDSYEVDDAQGQADWTPELFAAFETRRGYDLRSHLPALFEEGATEKSRRVRSDYRETISELLLETFTDTWSTWSHTQGAVIRNQAHGSPSNILDLYAASDIPETEGTDIIKAKMASSAAHVSGRPLVSAEAATWLGEHFKTNLADLKENVDRYFGAGINHIFYHGTCYSPPGDTYPGRLFYAAIHANPRNSLWADYPALNRYIERTQTYLQSSTPDNDVLVYFPAYDRYAKPGKYMLEHFDGFATGKHDKEKTEVRRIAEWLQDQGYGYDFISDMQINALTSEKGAVLTKGGRSYRTIVVPMTDYMPLATLQKLKALSQSGVPIIFDQRLPSSVPGYADLDQRIARFADLSAEMANISDIKISADLASSLRSVDIKRESLTDAGLEYHRRKTKNGTLYFVSNWSEANFDGHISLNTTGGSVVIYDPMTGQKGLAETKQGQVRLQLDRGASVVLTVNDTEDISELPQWSYLNLKDHTVRLDGPWQLNFLTGGPTLPSTTRLDSLQMWSEMEGDAYQDFSGTASYQIEFARPEGGNNGWVLDMGDVAESATITLNGSHVATCIGPIYRVPISKEMIKDVNTLEIKVSNSMANRVRAIERDGHRWQKFYNINVSAHERENLGSDRVFTTQNWSTIPSGLAGPVVLIEN